MNLFNYIYKKYPLQYKFFKDHQDLFKKTINGEVSSNKHLDNLRIIEKTYNVEFPYGKCFPISQFMFWYLGGYESKYVLKCIKKIPITINDYKFYTSHWFVHVPNQNIIIDLTKEQFDKILNIEEYYEKSRRANYGFKWYRGNPEKRYEYTVPCKQVLKLYHVYRKKINKLKQLEYYYQESPYEFN